VNELPHRAVIDLQAAPGQFGHQAAQREILLPAPLHQPIPMRAGNLLRLVAADLARFEVAGLAMALHPIDRRAVTDAKPRRRLTPRQPRLLDRRNHPLAQIDRIRLPHPGWPPSPTSRLNQNRPDLGTLPTQPKLIPL
jgi:hypothetical protein